MALQDTLNQMLQEAAQAIREAKDSSGLDELRVRFLGKKGSMTQILRQMGSLSPEERPAMGKLVNEKRAEQSPAPTENTETTLNQRYLLYHRRCAAGAS